MKLTKNTIAAVLAVLMLLLALSFNAAAKPSSAPNAYVGFWQETEIWNPGNVAIYNYKLYSCIDAPAAGEKWDENLWEYIGDMADLFGMEWVEFPEWNNGRDWAWGAFVIYQDQYFISMGAQAGSGPPSGNGSWSLCGYTDPELSPPAAPVGYWHNFVIWNPGDIAIHHGLVYRCTAKTIEKYSLVPGKDEDYWEIIGEIEEDNDIFDIESVKIPNWSSREWPFGAIVRFEGAYYMSMFNVPMGIEPANEDYWSYMKPVEYNYTARLETTRPAYYEGDSFTVDLVLNGNINYTQIMAEITYDAELLEYIGNDNLSGVIAACVPAAPGKVMLRSVPSSDLIHGVPCNDVKIVTLKFTITGSFAGSIDLGFDSVAVNPPAGYIGTTVAAIALVIEYPLQVDTHG